MSLCDICRNRGHSVLVCDGLSLPFRDGVFDAVICIAVIHHLSTEVCMQMLLPYYQDIHVFILLNLLSALFVCLWIGSNLQKCNPGQSFKADRNFIPHLVYGVLTQPN